MELLATAVFAILLTLLCALFVFYGVYRKQVIGDLKADALVMKNLHIFDDISDLHPDAYDLNPDTLRITVVNANGSVIFDSNADFSVMDNHEGLEDDTPKSVSGMTRVELPRIEKDFPEFHWPEWKQRCENQLKGYLEALEHRNLSYLGKVSVSLKDQVRLKIEEMEEKEIREEFDAIHVHQTEISRYDKAPGKCRIRIQSSVEYQHTLKTPDKKKNVEREKEQHRFNLELVYIQDITKIRDGETAISVNCPNCGAPVTDLGERVCPYCGGAVEPVNVRVWELHRIEEV